MKLLALFALALPAFGSTHIADVLYQSDGLTPAFGRISIQGQRRDANGRTALTSRLTVPIATGGAVDFRLEGGANVFFQATVYLTNANGTVLSSYDEPVWAVPATGSTLTLRDIRVPSPSITTYLPNGFYCLSVTNRHWAIITCPDGTSGIPSWSATPVTGGTRITDTVYAADGVTPVAGRIILQGYERDASGKTVLSGPLTIPIGIAGAVDFLLEGGSGVHFAATVYPTGGRQYQEPPWIIPDTVTALTIRDIRGAAVPSILAHANGPACISVGSGQWGYATCPHGPAIIWSEITSSIWPPITSGTWSTIIQ